jgi:hypothetical protein
MMREPEGKVCPYCAGGGLRYVLLNPDGYHCHSEEPNIGVDYCEECGGTGYVNDNDFLEDGEE